MKTPYTYITHWWQHWPFKWPTILALTFLIIIILFLALTKQADISTVKKTIPTQISAITLAELAQTGEISLAGTLEPATAAPLVARMGGRITALNFNLGSHISAGSTVASVDTGVVANPASAQISGLSRSLNIVAKLSATAQKAADLAVSQAQTNLDAVAEVKPLTLEQARVARRQADLQVNNTRLALDDARETPHDNVVRTADIANQAAQLAQDQTTVGLQLAQNQTQLTVDQATSALKTAIASRDRIISEIDLQSAQLQTQYNIAEQQFQLQQISSPITGEITRLSIRPGSYVNPGQVVGEVNAQSGARVTLNVSTGIRNQLTIGQTVSLTANGQSFNGHISQLADAPDSNSSLWQIDIIVTIAPSTIHPGSTVTVLLPAGRISTNNFYVPLDALVVRQSGIYIFSVQSNKAVPHLITVVGYDASFAEIQTDLDSSAQIITKGNRTLRGGEEIIIVTPSP